MPTFKRCDESVSEMAKSLMERFEDHQPLLDRKVRIDFVFAFPDYDETTGLAINDALKCQGMKALGITRKLSLKDRAMGRGDVEIALDGDWWGGASQQEAEALLDHELHHIAVSETDNDDIGRPKIKLRKHDVQFGWFTLIAQRHGKASQECQQAESIMENGGQYYWPAIAQPETQTEDQQIRRFAKIATEMQTA